jgi:hypothetical protein
MFDVWCLNRLWRYLNDAAVQFRSAGSGSVSVKNFQYPQCYDNSGYQSDQNQNRVVYTSPHSGHAYQTFSILKSRREVRDGEDTIASTRDACAPRNSDRYRKRNHVPILESVLKKKIVLASRRCNGRKATARLSNQHAGRVCCPELAADTAAATT